MANRLGNRFIRVQHISAESTPNVSPPLDRRTERQELPTNTQLRDKVMRDITRLTVTCLLCRRWSNVIVFAIIIRSLSKLIRID